MPDPEPSHPLQETKDKTDHRLAALTAFKDFTNYLLVTTVAATGWVATQGTAPAWWRAACAVLFAVSAMFGIFTLALIPPVAELVRAKPDLSIYEHEPQVRPVLGCSFKIKMCLKSVCWPQHVLFIAGILLYAFGTFVTSLLGSSFATPR